jgi:hypothetical protein
MGLIGGSIAVVCDRPKLCRADMVIFTDYPSNERKDKQGRILDIRNYIAWRESRGSRNPPAPNMKYVEI